MSSAKKDRLDRVFERHAKGNPFEHHHSKPKFEILNRRLRGVTGAPAISKSAAHQKRSSRLQGKVSGSFIDRRIGRRELSQEERSASRLALQRNYEQKAARQIVAEPSQEAILTHRGNPIDEIERFSDGFGDPDDSLDEGAVQRQFLSDRSGKSQALSEVIAKCKAWRAERQRIRYENIDMCDELNQDYDATLRSLLQSGSLKVESEQKDQPADLSYDQFLRELADEQRDAKASDPAKTAEQIAQQESERLAQLEKERVERMLKEENAEPEPEPKCALLEQPEEGSFNFDVLPFVIPIPQSVSSFTQLMEGRSVPEYITVVDRIRTYHSPLVHPESKPQLEKFCEIFVSDSLLRSFQADSVPGVYDLIKWFLGFFPAATARAFKAVTSTWLDRLRSGQEIGHSFLIFFDLALSCWCATDRFHPVLTPLLLVAAKIFSSPFEWHLQSVGHRLWLWRRYAASQQETRRIFPEALAFLRQALQWLSFQTQEPDAESSSVCSPGDFFSSVPRIPLPWLQLFATAAVSDVIDLYRQSVAFPELIAPLSSFTTPEQKSKIDQAVQKSQRPFLKFPPLARKEIPSLEPKFDAKYSVDSSSSTTQQPSDQTERENERLRRVFKRERKSAIRELRKEASFMADVRIRERIRQGIEHKQKFTALLGQIGNDSVYSTASNRTKKLKKF